MTSPKLRIAMVGAGMISAYHLRAWQKVAVAEVVAVVDPDPAHAARRAQEFGIPAQYPTVEALFAATRVDAVDIASPRETHAPILRFAARHGAASLCQKPFVPTYAEAEALVAEIAGGPRVMVNQNFRFRPYYVKMREWIDAGRVGEISGCTIQTRSCSLLPDAEGRFPYIERQPFVRHEKRGMIEEVLIHRVDFARWLLGELELVAARTAYRSPEIDGESEATLLCTARNGAAVVVDGNFMSHGYPKLSHERVEIAGAKARILLERDVLHLFGPEPEEIRYEHAVVYQQSFDATVAHFAACLASGAPFATPPEDNLETLRLVEAAYASAGERA